MSEVYISNKMTSTYSLVAVRESYVQVEITVGVYNDNDVAVEITPRVISKSEKQVQLEVKYGGHSEIEVEITPTINNDVAVEIEVAPHNRMVATYNLIEPAVITETVLPIQDSYVIQDSPYNTINYGKNNSMLVGNDNKGQNLAFIQFDMTNISHEVRIKSARLRVYYSQLGAENIELYKVDDVWSELGITYENKPTYSDLIANVYDSNTTERYLEFDIKDIVIGWIRGLTNNGLAIVSQDLGVNIFRTRESTTPPLLTVEYYSPLPYYFDKSQREVEITCQHLEEFEVPVEIEVHTTFVNHDVEVEIYAHNLDDVLESDKEIEITVSKPSVEVEIDITLKDTSEIEVEISCGIDSSSDIQAEIEVASYNGLSDVEVEIETKALPTKAYSNVEVEIEIKVDGDPTNAFSSVPVEIEVASYDGTNDIEAEITVPYNDSSDIQVEIEISRATLESDSDIQVEIEIVHPYTLKSSSVPVEIEIASHDGTSHVEAEIDVKGFYYSSVEVEIEALRVIIEDNSDVEVEISVPTLGKDDMIVEYFISKPFVEAEITVPYYKKNDIEVEIQARVLLVNDVQVEIEVNNTRSSYAYIYII